jgi:hypothetical protein
MSNYNPLDLLEFTVQEKIEFFRRMSKYNRGKALFFTIAPATLSATATVAIGISEKLSVKWMVIVALVASAAATVLGAWEGLFSNRKLWVVDGIALAEFEELQWTINYRKKKESTQPITQSEIDGYNDKYINIVQKTEKAWQTIIAK